MHQTSDEYALSDDSESQSENDTVAGQESQTLIDEATADQTQGNADASAEASFQIAQANETSSVWSWMVAQFPLPSGEGQGEGGGLPWAQAQAALASAEATWAVTAAANYQTYVAALGTAEMAYADSNSEQFDTEITTIDAADKTAADSQADADETQVAALAADEATFETTLAPAIEAWQIAVAEAQHTETYAAATAGYNYMMGGSLSDYTAAVSAAGTAEQLADAAANVAFGSAEGAAVSAQTISDAAATLAAITAAADAALTDIESDAGAIDDYLDGESGDYDTEVKADAVAEFVRILADANAQSAAADSVEQSDPSPWSAQGATVADAAAVLAAAQAAAQQTATDTAADDEEAAEIASNDAQKVFTDGQAQAWHDQLIALAQSQNAFSLSGAGTAAQLSAADAFFAAVGSAGEDGLPSPSSDQLDGPGGPSSGSTAIIPAALTPPGGDTPITLTGDYGNTHPIGAFNVGDTTDLIDGLVARMFSTAPDAEPSALRYGTLQFAWFGTGSGMPYGELATSIQPGLNMLSPDGAAPIWSSSATNTTFGPQIFAQNGEDGASGGQTPPASSSNAGGDTNPRIAKETGDKEQSDNARNWDPKTVQSILGIVSPQLAAWWGKYANGGYNGQSSDLIMQGQPKIGNIQSSGQRLWVLWEIGPSADPGQGGTKGDRPVTVSVPDSWSSEQVADYIIQQAKPGGALAQEYAFGLQAAESGGNLDAWMRGKTLQNQNVGAGLEQAGQLLKDYLEFVAGLNPVGAGIFSLDHLFKGEVLAAVIGMATVIPFEKFIALVERLPAKGLTVKFANGEASASRKALEVLNGLDDAQRIHWSDKLKNAKSADEAQKIFDELDALAPSAIPDATRLSVAEHATAGRLQAKLGLTLKESAHEGAEYVDELGRYYDQIGDPPTARFWNERNFIDSIARHLRKSNEFTVIDMTGFTTAQIEAVRKYLDGLSPELQARIIRIGF